MKFVNKNNIEIDKILSDLDKFAIDFIKILEKHTNYVIISGYVAILLGRSRASEDIDILIPKINYQTLQNLVDDLKDNSFYCLNAEKNETIFSYLEDNLAVRFAKEGKIIPNIELKWVKNKIDKLSLERIITVKLPKTKLKISNLDLQIAFKENVLKSPKDLEDARHIRDVAESLIDEKIIDKYKEMLSEFY
jgi:hypothetical protein